MGHMVVGHKSNIDDIIRDGRLLNTPDRRGDGHVLFQFRFR